MPKAMKYHPHGSVLFCTFSLEEGLLLLANPLCKAIVKTCLARAAKLYRVRICHYIVSTTHIHLILVVINPDDVQAFMRHFKTDSAHMINRLLGRAKRTVWCSGYDSPVVLSSVRALAAIAYLYANPAKDNLETSIDNYPGMSSWRMFRTGQTTRRWKRLYRDQFSFIPRDAHNLRGYTKRAQDLLAASKEDQVFTIEPNAWLEAFGYRDPEEQERINKRLVARVRLLEERAEKLRIKNKKRVIGRERLNNQVLDTTYRPKRKGRKMWCLAERRSLRLPFIRFFTELMRKARAVRERWKFGDFSVPYPPGLHPPSMPKLANVIGR
jgi:REP element-mobilizing transposase RayT